MFLQSSWPGKGGCHDGFCGRYCGWCSGLQSFDIVLCALVIEHAADRRATLREFFPVRNNIACSFFSFYVGVWHLG
jgi:hypothetical protein